MQLGGRGSAVNSPSRVRKNVFWHFGAPETAYGDIKFRVFAVQKNKQHNFGPRGHLLCH